MSFFKTGREKCYGNFVYVGVWCPIGVERWFEMWGSYSHGQNLSWNSLADAGQGKERPVEEKKAGLWVCAAFCAEK